MNEELKKEAERKFDIDFNHGQICLESEEECTCAIKEYALELIDRAVLAERARCAEIAKKRNGGYAIATAIEKSDILHCKTCKTDYLEGHLCECHGGGKDRRKEV